MEGPAAAPIANPGTQPENRADPGRRSQEDGSVNRRYSIDVNGPILDAEGNVVGEAQDWQDTTEGSYRGDQPAFDALFPRPTSGGSAPSSPVHPYSGPSSPVFPDAVPSEPGAFSYPPSLNLSNSPRLGARKPSIDSYQPVGSAQGPPPLGSPGLGQARFKWYVGHHRYRLIQAVPKQTRSGLGHFFKNPESRFQRGKTKESEKVEESDVEKQTKPKQPAMPSRIELSFAELQRMRLRKLQCKLVEYVTDMYLTAEEPASDDWEVTLKEYIQAWRDYEYMTEVISNVDRDPFIASSGDPIDCFVLNEIMKRREDSWPPPEDHEKLWPKMKEGRDKFIFKDEWGNICEGEKPGPEDRSEATPIGATRRAKIQKSQLKSLQGRLLMAAGGAFFLVAPMWIMVLHNTKYTGLVSTSVFVFVFGVLAAAYLEKPMEVVSSTAAYAAVLVVFVGTSLGEAPKTS